MVCLRERPVWFSLLSLIRSQLQILFGVCGIIFLYIICMRRKQGDRRGTLFRIMLGAVGCLIISLVGVLLVSRIGGGYQYALNEEGRLFYFAMSVQDPEDYLDEMRLLAAMEESLNQSVSDSQESVEEEESVQEESSLQEKIQYKKRVHCRKRIRYRKKIQRKKKRYWMRNCYTSILP